MRRPGIITSIPVLSDFGYSYNTNLLNDVVGGNLDGCSVGQSAVQLFQAASTATINQHRIAGGIGRQCFLVPSLDLDLFAGGLFNAHDEFGDLQASLAIYYVGTGLTWRYGTIVPGNHNDVAVFLYDSDTLGHWRLQQLRGDPGGRRDANSAPIPVK